MFKLNGYPDWYDKFKDKEKGKRGPRVAAYVYAHNAKSAQDAPLVEVGPITSSTRSTSQFGPNLVQALAQEVMKFMKGKQVEQ